VSDAPHAPQNLAPAGASVPHAGHRRASGVPQDMQNDAPGGLAVWHVPQVSWSPIRVILPYGPAGPSPRRDTALGMPGNLEIAQSIIAHWARGHWTAATWADPDVEFVIADGPDPRSFAGVQAMVDAWREFLTAWEDYATAPEEFREISEERVLVLLLPSGRGKASGIDLAAGAMRTATVLDFRDGVVTRLAIYFDRRNALRDVGLEA
jgi:hypothetical protein